VGVDDVASDGLVAAIDMLMAVDQAGPALD